ncbi:hypothetical protein ASG22_10460 [Chryseobacterium sp. Leaf405]|uniref:outer membrane beta-barrel family protein n=1 Tax=Chryseobacterium sp. Leaf405 TaxID=1736367 RepID=UPI0006F64962|nr:outer membrane beta-barrel family protein [Chryseobacterium sp. Leaf405]KQT24421.1 hypothetical protein ASG22_10460 [Chryseobacterium sp. Leaf405]
MQKTSLIAATFFLAISTVSAQNIINGKVTDIKGQSIPFALIKVADNKANVISEKISDENGVFNVQVPQNGSYNVLTSASGYAQSNKSYEFNNTTNNIIISIEKEKVAGIKEVILVAKKKTFERKIDRFVFNTENSIASKGVDGLDVLAATPMVKADDEGNIEIVGKSSVSIMINDRPVNLSGKDLVSYLKTLRSENIARIEVITTPPAKYEAQGNSGIINIVLKQNSNMGFSGNISTSYQRRSRNGYANNGSLNYQSKKINTSLRISQFDNEKKSDENLSIYANSILAAETRRIDKSKGYNINYSIDYKINDKTSLGAIYNYSDTDGGNDSKNLSKYYQGNVLDSTVTSNTYNSANIRNNQLNVYFERKLDSLGKKLYLGGNLFDSRNDNPFSLASSSNNANNINYQLNSKYRYKIYSGQADFYLPFKNFVGEIGGKYTRFNTDTGLDFFVNDNNTPQYDSGRSNTFDYNENNWASYITLSKTFNEKWEGKAGLRYEYTSLTGVARNGDKVENEYGKWFPSLYLTYKPDKKNILTLSYSKRITRPDARSLNPTTIYLDPYAYVTGNPYLKPSFSNNFELGYVFNNKLSVTGYYQFSRDNFGQIVELQGANRTVKYLNNYDENSLGINATYSNTFLKRWDFYASANYAYVESKGLIDQVEGLSSNSLYYSLNNTIHLNSNKTFSFLLNFWNFLPHTKGNFKFENVYNLSTGLRMSLFEKKLQVNMTIQDLLKGMKFRGKAYYTDYYTYSNNYYDARTFNLSVTYQFGNSKVRGNNKQIKLEEVDRAN